jgi:hypothetical protein
MLKVVSWCIPTEYTSFYQFNPFHYSSLPFPSNCPLFNSFQYISLYPLPLQDFLYFQYMFRIVNRLKCLHTDPKHNPQKAQWWKKKIVSQNKYKKKSLNILSHQWNANQNCIEIPLATVRISVIEKTSTAKTNVSKDAWRQRVGAGREALIHCSCECKLPQLLWKSLWSSSKIKLKIILPCDPAIPHLGIYQKESK